MSDVKAETRLAKVVHIADPGFAPGPLEIVINRGLRQGVKPGDRFLVFGIGPHITDPDTGEDLGQLELVRGRGEVVHVQEHLATICTLERRRTRPAKRIIPTGLSNDRFLRGKWQERPAPFAGEKRPVVWAVGIRYQPAFHPCKGQFLCRLV
jgi:hypothetical protein